MVPTGFGTRIPPNFITPPKPSSKAWAKYLRKKKKKSTSSNNDNDSANTNNNNTTTTSEADSINNTATASMDTSEKE